jgi:hypothetical protein
VFLCDTKDIQLDYTFLYSTTQLSACVLSKDHFKFLKCWNCRDFEYMNHLLCYSSIFILPSSYGASVFGDMRPQMMCSACSVLLRSKANHQQHMICVPLPIHLRNKTRTQEYSNSVCSKIRMGAETCSKNCCRTINLRLSSFCFTIEISLICSESSRK